MFRQSNSVVLGAAMLGIILGAGSAAHAVDLQVPAQFPTIQSAIDAAQAGDVVIVSDGVYTGHGNRDLSYRGKAITVRSVNGPDVTIIDANGTNENPHRGFIFTHGETADAVLDGFTITRGATLPGAIADQFNGGAILCNNGSSPTIKNCIMANNTCGCWGAALCATDASPTLINCQLIGNAADDDGGGIFAWGSSSPTIINTLIANNSAPVTGGGILMFGTSATLINTTIVGNEAGWASGLYVTNATISNSIIWGNEGDQLILDNNTVVTSSNVQGGAPGVGNMSVDPMFVNPAAGDFHISPLSPLVNAGRNDLVPVGSEFDMDGDLRILGGRVDIGADEQTMVTPPNFDTRIRFDLGAIRLAR